MKKSMLVLLSALGIFTAATANATDLIEVFHQALASDPTYHQQIEQALAIEENVPISRSVLFPQINATAVPSITKSKNTGPFAVTTQPAANTRRAFLMNLNITQTIFNFAQFSALANAKAGAKQAIATVNYQLQNLILRVAKAYFDVLEAEDNLVYSKANKDANAKQLYQINQQYKVGLKTLTDVYTAQASYDTATAFYITAETQLANNKESLRAITCVYYCHLAKLSEKFPLQSPQPANMERWVETALQQNWLIKASQYGVQAACETIKQQFAGHLPTLNVQGIYNVNVERSSSPLILPINGTNIETVQPGSGKFRNAILQLNLAVPIFAGGQVVSLTNQARYNYQAAIQQLEFNARQTVTTARQKYLDVTSGIKKIQADKQAIKSATSSFEGLQEGYLVGTQTLVDVLNQLQKVFLAQLTYARDRYAYVNNLLELKNAAGTLSQEDLCIINAWLVNNNEVPYQYKTKKHSKNKDKIVKKKIIKISLEHKAIKQKNTEKKHDLSKANPAISLPQLVLRPNISYPITAKTWEDNWIPKNLRKNYYS